MSIYTHKTTSSLNKIFNISCELTEELSDQYMNKLLEEARLQSNFKVSSPMKGHKHTPETISLMKQWKPSEETKKKMSKAHTGKTLSETHKSNMSKNHADVNGEKNPMYGKIHPNRGKKFYNNGSKQSLFVEGQQPNGWVKGGLPRAKILSRKVQSKKS